MHDDENTSVEAAFKFLNERGGKLIHLEHTGRRMIAFSLNKDSNNQITDTTITNAPALDDSAVMRDDSFRIDPNRIFTDAGRKATLTRQGKYSPEAEKEVELFAQLLLSQYLDQTKLIVALHNNAEKALSILSYTKGGSEEGNTANYYINPSMDIDDFILTTEYSIFDKLKRMKINVVLQDNETVIDDGSLSVYAAVKRIPYINIEAQHGHVEEQLNMLKSLDEILKTYETIPLSQ